jgi:putative ABC transport system permease protein
MRWFRHSDEDYREEIIEHVELETRANIERGMDPDEARRAALVAFGSVVGTRQRLHEGRSGSWLSALRQDVRYGLRMIRRNTLLSCIVVLTMSIGVGSTTAVFSVVNAMAFAPPVRHDPGSYVQFVSGDGDGFQVATTQRYEALRRQTRSLRELAAWSVIPLGGPIGKDDSTPVQAQLVSCNLFSVLSPVPPTAGRTLQETDCAAGAPVAMMSRNLWRTRFASDSAIVGRGVSYGGHQLTIVGIAELPPQPDGSFGDLWLPYTAHQHVKDLSSFGPGLFDQSDFDWLGMIGRLSPGFSRRAAAAEFRVFTSREQPDPDQVIQLKLTDGSLWSMAPIETLWMFSAALAFPTLVMLIVCATVATLLLSRAVKRQREMAIRLSVGGSRFRLIRMLLVETVMLAGMAALISVALVYALPPIILRLWASAPSAPPQQTIHPDWRVIAYMGVVTVLTAIFAGLAPAMESLNLQLVESLKGRLALSGRRGVSFTRGFLVATQVAFSMVLLVSAAAILRADRWFAAPGFETRQVVFTELPRDTATAHTPTSLATVVAASPTVRSAAYAGSLPLVFEEGLYLHGPGESRQAILSADVSAGYFETLGIRILSGRAFRATDSVSKNGDRPAVVSQRFASRFLPGQSPVGRTLNVLGPSMQDIRLEIVGVASDRVTGFGPIRAPGDGSFVYRLKEPSLEGYLLVRFDGDAGRFTTALQGLLKQGTGWVVPVSTLQSLVDRRFARVRGIETLLMALGAIGLSLALIGVFGILTFTAAQRRKEVAIRSALGASRTDIFATTVSPALRPTGIGVGVGAFLSFVALRLAESQRVVPLGLPSLDPLVYLNVGLLMLCATFAVMTPPAYRAAQFDPARALRED